MTSTVQLLLFSWMIFSAASTAAAATFEVNRLDDDDGPCAPDDCSFREATLAAAASPGRDTILLSSGVHTISIPPLDPDSLDPLRGSYDIWDHDVDIVGVGPQLTILDARGLDRVLHIAESSSTISGVRLVGGSATEGGGLRVALADLALEDVWVDGNEAVDGGGVFVLGSRLVVDRTAITGNRATEFGGAFFVFGLGGLGSARLEITNSTISGNQADAVAAIHLEVVSSVDIEYTTVADNLDMAGTSTVDGLFFNLSSDARYSLVEGTCPPGGTTNCLFLSSKDDFLEIADLGVDSLALDGGSTPTHGLTSGSPALDVVPLGEPCPAEDQRSFPRPLDGDGTGTALCDAGAFEFGNVAIAEVPGPVGILGRLFAGLLALVGLWALRR